MLPTGNTARKAGSSTGLMEIIHAIIRFLFLLPKVVGLSRVREAGW